MTGGGVWEDPSTGGRQIIRVRMWPPGNGVGRRGRVLGQMQSSSMQQFMLVYEEVRRLETGRTPQVGRIGWYEGGGSRRHTRQLTAWIPTGGGGTCRYLPNLPVQDTADKGTPCLPACVLFSEGPDRDDLPGPWKWQAWKVQVGTCLPRYLACWLLGCEADSSRQASAFPD